MKGILMPNHMQATLMVQSKVKLSWSFSSCVIIYKSSGSSAVEELINWFII